MHTKAVQIKMQGGKNTIHYLSSNTHLAENVEQLPQEHRVGMLQRKNVKHVFFFLKHR